MLASASEENEKRPVRSVIWNHLNRQRGCQRCCHTWCHGVKCVVAGKERCKRRRKRITWWRVTHLLHFFPQGSGKKKQQLNKQTKKRCFSTSSQPCTQRSLPLEVPFKFNGNKWFEIRVVQIKLVSWGTTAAIFWSFLQICITLHHTHHKQNTIKARLLGPSPPHLPKNRFVTTFRMAWNLGACRVHQQVQTIREKYNLSNNLEHSILFFFPKCWPMLNVALTCCLC